jgi:integrase
LTRPPVAHRPDRGLISIHKSLGWVREYSPEGGAREDVGISRSDNRGTHGVGVRDYGARDRQRWHGGRYEPRESRKTGGEGYAKISNPNPYEIHRYLRAFSSVRDWRRVCRSKKLPLVGFHALRYTHASTLIAQGIDIFVVSRRPGHRKASTTLDTYAHLIEGKERDAAKAIEEILK